MLGAELYPGVEHTLRCTGCNGLARIGQGLSEARLKALAVGRAVGHQACGRVDEYGVVNSAQRALRGLPLPRQNGAEHTRVVLGVAASQLLQRCVLQAVLGRVKTVLGQFAVYGLPQAARGGDGQLVQAVVSAENQGVIAALSEAMTGFATPIAEDFTRAGLVMGPR